MGGRLREDMLDRLAMYGASILEVVEQLERDRRHRRVIDQIAGSGTSPGAQVFEANEALSRADFIKSMGWAAKELSETLYWLRVMKLRRWVDPSTLDPLLAETNELLSIVKTIIARSKRPPAG